MLFGRQQQPALVADDTVSSLLYGGEHPYGRPAAGSSAALGRLDAAAVAAFHRAHHGARDAVLAVCGDVDSERAFDTVARHFSDWLPGAGRGATPPVPAERAPGPRLVLVDRPGSRQAEVRIGAIAAPYGAPDTFALQLLETVVGGSFTSRVNRSLREEKAWTYGARARLRLRRAAGPFLIQASVDPAHTAAAIAELSAQIRRLRQEPPTAEEMRLAQRSLAFSLYLQLETNGQIARKTAAAAAYDLPEDYWRAYARNVEAVRRDEVVEVVERYLDERRLAIVAVGDAATLGDDLERLGPVEIRRPAASPPAPTRPPVA